MYLYEPCTCIYMDYSECLGGIIVTSFRRCYAFVSDASWKNGTLDYVDHILLHSKEVPFRLSS